MKIFLAFALLIVVGLLAKVNAASPALIVVLLPGTSLQDWQNADTPNLHRLMQTGALAVMNTRTAHRPGQRGRETPQSALLTLGAGARAAGADPGTNVAYSAFFERRSGLQPSADQWVCLNWPSVLNANRHVGYDLRLGSLADTLAAHGVKIAAGGGPDAAWIAAGNNGTVQQATQLEAAPGLCLIWDAGPNLTAADAVLAAAAAQVAAHTGRLIVLSPYAGDADYRRSERLTPVLIWGQGIPAGLIISPSTRRPGLVTDTDLAPSIAADFGIPRTEFHPLPFGFAWAAQAALGNVQTVQALNKQAVQQAQGMGLLPYLAVAVGLWTGLVTLLLFRQQRMDIWALVPLAAFIAALFAVSALSFAIILLVCVALAFILTQRWGLDGALAILTGGSAAVLALDMVTGNRLMHQGLLGYSAIEGARYYGIGNEAMGLLLGSALTAASRFWSADKTRQLGVIGLLAGLVLLFGSAGAKAGGVLDSLTVFGVFLYTVSGRPWTLRTAAMLSIIVVFGMAAAALADAFFLPKSHSHIGEAVRRIASGGSSEALDIVQRKLAVEGRLAYHSAWAVLLWIGLLCTVLLWKRAAPKTQTATALRTAGIVGVAVCLLLNDAGVVAAGILVVTIWSDAAIQKQSPSDSKSLSQRG